MCIIDDNFEYTVGASQHLSPANLEGDFNKSFNPMSEPNDDSPYKSEDSPEFERSNTNLFPREDCGTAEASCNGETEFTFPSEPWADEEDEVTE